MPPRPVHTRLGMSLLAVVVAVLAMSGLAPAAAKTTSTTSTTIAKTPSKWDPRLEPIAAPRPAWWDLTSLPPARPALAARPTIQTQPRPASGFLFPVSPPAETSDGSLAPPWLDRLMTSPV